MSIKHWAQNKVLRTAYKGKEKVQYFSGTYQDLQQKTLSYVFAAYTVESYRNIARTSQRIRPNKSMDNLQQVQWIKTMWISQDLLFWSAAPRGCSFNAQIEWETTSVPSTKSQNKYNIKSRQVDVQYQYHKYESRLIRSPTLQISHTTGQWLQRAGIVTDQSSLSAECPLTAAPLILRIS